MNLDKFAIIMDHFGIIAFAFIVFYALTDMQMTMSLLIVGMLGLLVDSFIVASHYLR